MRKILIRVLILVTLVAAGMFAMGKEGVPVEAGKPAKSECTTIQDGTLLASDGSTITVGYDDWGYNYQAHLFNGGYCDAYRDAEWCQDYKDINLMMKWNDAWLSNKDCDRDDLLDRHYNYPSYIGSGAWLTNHQSGEYESTTDWNVVGEWVLDFDFGSHYIHDMVIDTQDLGLSLVTEDIMSEVLPYSHEWLMTGTIEGSDIDLIITYQTGNPGYEVILDGAIDSSGVMSGTCTTSSSQNCNWTTTSGVAIRPMCKWNYFVKIVAAPEDANDDGVVWYTADGIEIGPVIWGAFAVTQEVSNDPCGGENGLLYKGDAPTGFGFYTP